MFCRLFGHLCRCVFRPSGGVRSVCVPHSVAIHVVPGVVKYIGRTARGPRLSSSRLQPGRILDHDLDHGTPLVRMEPAFPIWASDCWVTAVTTDPRTHREPRIHLLCRPGGWARSPNPSVMFQARRDGGMLGMQDARCKMHHHRERDFRSCANSGLVGCPPRGWVGGQ